MSQVSPRITAKSHNISLICTHVPTEDKHDALKDAFYANLEDLYYKYPVHDIKIVFGSINAKVEQEGIFGNFAKQGEADRFRRGSKHGSL